MRKLLAVPMLCLLHLITGRDRERAAKTDLPRLRMRRSGLWFAGSIALVSVASSGAMAQPSTSYFIHEIQGSGSSVAITGPAAGDAEPVATAAAGEAEADAEKGEQ